MRIAAQGTAGNVRYQASVAGNTVYITVFFSCNNNATTTSITSTQTSVTALQTAGQGNTNPLNGMTKNLLYIL